MRNSKSDELDAIEEMHNDVFYDVLDYILKCSESNLIPKFVGSIQKAFPESNMKAYNSALNALRLHENVALEQMQGAVPAVRRIRQHSNVRLHTIASCIMCREGKFFTGIIFLFDFLTFCVLSY